MTRSIRGAMRFSLAIATLMLAALMLTACSSEAVRFLSDVEAGPGASALKDATPRPQRRAHAVPGTEADLYVPGESARARMVLVPGLSEDGRRDPRLVPFAESLARTGFLVLVPDLPAARALRADAADAEAIAAAVAAMPDGPGPLGVAAISYAAGPAFLAALDPATASRVDFVITLGAYHDTETLATFLATGAHRGPGESDWRQGRPDAEALWLFLLANAASLPDPDDAEALRTVAAARLRGRTGPDPATLGEDARAVLALADETDPEAVPDRLAALPAPLRDTLSALSLAEAGLDRFVPCAILIHGRADPVVPWTESVRLARALPQGRSRLHLIPGLDHIDPATLPLRGRLRLLSATEDLLAARDGADACAAVP